MSLTLANINPQSLSTAGANTNAVLAAMGGKNMNIEQMNAAAKDFESMFISQMVEQMFGESIGNDAFGTEDTEEVYKGMMVQEYGKVMSNAGGIGIADYVKRELLKLQEATS